MKKSERLTPTKSEIKKWVAALRSGKYNQAAGALQNERGYCCLGVACKIFIPKDKLELVDGFISGGMPVRQENSPRWLDDIIDDLDSITGMWIPQLNDSGYTFDEIADILELVYIHNAFGKVI